MHNIIHISDPLLECVIHIFSACEWSAKAKIPVFPYRGGLSGTYHADMVHCMIYCCFIIQCNNHFRVALGENMVYFILLYTAG